MLVKARLWFELQSESHDELQELLLWKESTRLCSYEFIETCREVCVTAFRQRANSRQLRSALHGWQHLPALRRQQAEHMARADRHRRSQVLQRWRQAPEQERQRVAEAVHLRQRQKARRALRAWRDQSQLQRALREAHAQTAQRYRRSVQSQFFGALKSFVQRKQLMQKALEQFRSQQRQVRTATALHAWKAQS